jgi:uncharacterized protein YndB with AHSA1/START domain
MALVFKALADPTRRVILDRLRARDGQTLNELCDGLGMARQSVTQHLDLLADAALVSVVRRGRERRHYLNPEPIHRIHERWISAFGEPRLAALSAIRRVAEGLAMTNDDSGSPVPTYVYITYVRATAQQVWKALTDADLTARYWGHTNVSDWRPGSRWEHRRLDDPERADVVGRVLEVDAPNLLRITFEPPEEQPAVDASVVTFTLEPGEGITRLVVTHENLPDRTALEQASHGWPAVLANLKSLLETGDVLPQFPWEMAPAAHYDTDTQ